MKGFFFIIAFLITCSSLSAQQADLMKKSDELYAKGVELYKVHKYREAIPFFAQSDSIDGIVLDSTCNRSAYSLMWEASCYYKLGDEEKAKSLSENWYGVQPVDRRLTVECDSLMSLSTDCFTKHDYPHALEYARRSAEMDRLIVGDDSPFYANDLSQVGSCYFAVKDTVQAFATLKAFADIYRKTFGENSLQHAQALDELLSLYDSCHDYAHVTATAEGMLSIYESVYGLKSLQYIQLLSMIYDLYIREHQTDKILETGKRLTELCSLCMKSKTDEASKNEVRDMLILKSADVSTIYFDMNKIPDALQYMKISLAAQDGRVPVDTAYYQRCLNTMGQMYERIDDLSHELAAHQKALTLFKDTTDRDYIYTLDNLSYAYNNLGMYDKALSFSRRAIQIAEHVYGDTDSIFFDVADNSISTFIASSRFNEAISLAQRVLSLKENLYGKTDGRYIESLINLSKIQERQGDNSAALVNIAKALDIIKSAKTRNDMQYIDASAVLANLYEDRGKMNEVISTLQEICDIRKSYSRFNPFNYAESLIQLALAKSKIHSDYSDVMSMFDQAMHIYQSLEINTTAILSARSYLATAYSNYGYQDKSDSIVIEDLHSIGDYNGYLSVPYASALVKVAAIKFSHDQIDECFDCYSKSLELLKNNDANMGYYASILNDMANCYNTIGNRTEAIQLGEQCIAIYDSIGMHNSIDYAKVLNSLSLYYGLNGDTKKSYQLSNEALEIGRKLVGENDLVYIDLLSSAASNHNIQNDSEGALDLELMAEKLILNKYGYGSFRHLTSLQNIASYQSSLGLYDEALQTSCRLLEITDSIYGKMSFAHCNSANQLARIEYFKGNHQKAADLISEVINYYESKSLSVPSYILSNAAMIDASVHKYDKAVDMQQQLLKNISDDTGTENSQYFDGLVSLYIYKLNNHDKDYLDVLSRAMALGEKLYGQNNGNMLVVLFYNSITKCMLGNYGEAVSSAIALSNLSERVISGILESETSETRFRYWKSVDGWYSQVLPYFAYRMKNDSLASQLYNGLLYSKGILLNTEISLQHEIFARGDAQIINRYKKLQTNKILLNKLLESPKYSSPTRIDSLKKIVYIDERVVMEYCKQNNLLGKAYDVKWQDVRQQLADSSAAVEFTSCPVFGSDSILYSAVVITKNCKCPFMIPLFSNKDFDRINPRNYYTSDSLCNLIWKPMAEKLAGVKDIYFSPTGKLHQIGIEYLPLADGTNIADKYHLYRLSSTRELVSRKTETQSRKVVLYGGLEYAFGQKDWVNIKSSLMSSDSSRLFAFRDVPSLDLRSLRQGLQFLEGTQKEVDNIDRQLKEKHIPVALVEGMMGTEDSFKRLSGRGVNILHIATHGFYQPDDTIQRKGVFNILQMLGSDNRNMSEEDRTLSRSGLFMAGAADALTDNGKKNIPEGMDDGILTAKEISRLDLRGLDLLVLSACQTGQGDVTSDGVFGLQRGFKKAGAQTIVMSLWKVDDTATQILMQQFYKSLTDSMTKRQAFLAAQQYLRTTENGRFNKPQYWAAFIMLDGIK